MVMRNSGPVEVGGQRGTLQVRQSAASTRYAPDVDKYKKGGTLPSESTADRIIGSLIPLGQKIAGRALDEQLEQKYLEGVQAAAQGKAEEELSTNPFTADWTKAGYRDTAGRLAISQHQAQLALDMPKLAKGTQEEFRAYMDEKRPALTQQLQGMSKRQRAAAFGQMANDEVAANKRYVTARSAWVLDQEQASIQQAMTVRRNNMDAAKSDMTLYQEEVKGFVGAIYKDVWQNPKLTPELQKDMTRQAMEFAASSDNVAVYQAMKDTEVSFADGSKGTMMSRLSFEDQIKVDKAHRSSMERVKVNRSQDFETKIAASEAAWADPNIGPMESYEEVDAMLKSAEDAGILGVGKRESVLKNYFKAKAKNQSNGALAQAYAVGDQQAMFSKGKDQNDGLKAWLKVNANQPLPQVVSGLAAIGQNHGMDSAFTQIGEVMKPVFAELGYKDEINPTNAKLATDMLGAITQAEKTNPGAKAKLLQSLTADQQDIVLYMAEAQAEGNTDPMTITKMARAKSLQDKQTGGLRSEMVRKARTEDAAVVQEIEDRQILGTMSSTAKAWFSADAANKKKLGTGRWWFENEDRTQEIMANGKMALAEELSIIAQNNPSMTADSRKSKALAAVAGRTVDTSSGPLVMPRGQTLQSYFGAPASADQALVGQAIDKMLTPAEGNRISWSIGPQNELMFTERNKDGQIVPTAGGGGHGYINPKDVSQAIDQIVEEQAQEAMKLTGPGIQRKGVSYNGENTAGAEPAWMLALRSDIVDSEGVRNTRYADSGGQSFGVGIHQSNNNYQEPRGPNFTYTPAQIQDSFMRASDTAAGMAVRIMKQTGVEGEQYLRLFGELAYQSPNSARDADMLAHIRMGNKAEAAKALMKTAAFRNSPAQRQAQYLTKLKAAMR